MHPARSATDQLVGRAMAFTLLLGFVTGVIHAQAGPAPAGDPDAMLKIAAAVPKIDINGVRLGMTPAEAVAALKAANPAFKIDLYNTRLERPGIQGFVRVPTNIVGHTVGPSAWRQGPSDPSGEYIAVQFTTPPARSVVARIERRVSFPLQAPVLASTLIDALQKKYGDSPFTSGQPRIWAYDAGGKPITQPLPAAARHCVPSAPAVSGWGSDPNLDQGTISLATTSAPQSPPDVKSDCVGYTFVYAYNLGESTLGKTPLPELWVVVQSDALLYGAYTATHDWLQQMADGVQKQQDNTLAKQKAPKM